jgi:acetamidase/formamidase
MNAPMKNPFAETPQHWVPIGLNPDLNEAMKDAVRQTIQFLSEKLGMDRAAALAYSSAAVNFQVTQVVDGVKGVHALIRKSDFRSTTTPH